MKGCPKSRQSKHITNRWSNLQKVSDLGNCCFPSYIQFTISISYVFHGNVAQIFAQKKQFPADSQAYFIDPALLAAAAESREAGVAGAAGAAGAFAAPVDPDELPGVPALQGDPKKKNLGDFMMGLENGDLLWDDMG